MELGLSGKVAVVSGGSVGIGLAVARGLAAEGAHVLICARNEERVMARAADIGRDFGVRAVGVAADVTGVAGIARIQDAVEVEFCGADILISNAGTGSNETIMDAADEKWQYYWELHVMAAVRLSRALAHDGAARRWDYYQQCLDMCQAAAGLRTDLQRYQSGPDDVLQVPGQRAHW